jgi:uncharacterized LabA/DUF88 family protein
MDFRIKLLFYLWQKLKTKSLSEAEIIILGKHIQKVKFYLRLKPVKIYIDEEGRTTKKANCDVDMTFDLMRLVGEYSKVVVLSGDGDFAVLLKYLKEIGKDLVILARGERTAKEIRRLAGGDFKDFHYLREILKFRK